MSITANNLTKTFPMLFLATLILFFSKAVYSAGYTGIIVGIFSEDKEVLVKAKINSVPQTITLQVEAANDLKLFDRLQIGDYLAFQAQNTIKKNYYKLISIDYVGLDSLIDIWTGDDGLCYHFTHFSQLTVFEQDAFGSCFIGGFSSSTMFPKTFKYFITPNESSWDILVSDRDLYFSAEFNFKNADEIFARIFDTDTGKINSELTLWR